MSNTLLRVCPSDLKMPFELKRQNSACLELVNKTDQRVAFKVKTTSPKKYAVRPANGFVPPRGSFGITIMMQAPKEIPPDYHCKDKFLVQSVVVEEGTTLKDIDANMFSKAPGKLVEEIKVRVIYVPANPPSPVPEEAEEEDSLDSDVDHEVERPSTSNSDLSLVSNTIKNYAEENKKIQKELEFLRKTKPSPLGFSATFVLLIFSFCPPWILLAWMQSLATEGSAIPSPRGSIFSAPSHLLVQKIYIS